MEGGCVLELGLGLLLEIVEFVVKLPRDKVDSFQYSLVVDFRLVLLSRNLFDAIFIALSSFLSILIKVQVLSCSMVL